MVRFKTVKFKHYRKARALTAREDAGEDIEAEYLTFVISMTEEWDFEDEETGELLSVDVSSLDELTLEQMNELAGTFNSQFGDMSQVKKTIDEPLPSTSMPSKPDVSLASDFLSGSQSLSLPDDSE